MATLLYDLNEYVVTDNGEVIVKYKHLVYDCILSGHPINKMKTFKRSDAEQLVAECFSNLIEIPLSDIQHHNRLCASDRMIPIVEIDEKPESPPNETYEFNIPVRYKEIDLDQFVIERLSEKFNKIPDVYVERVSQELDMIVERGMEEFVRSLIFIIEKMEQNNIVHGVGRGSACASLVFFLIGVHMVDPIKYEIPIEEFFR